MEHWPNEPEKTPSPRKVFANAVKKQEELQLQKRVSKQFKLKYIKVSKVQNI